MLGVGGEGVWGVGGRGGGQGEVGEWAEAWGGQWKRLVWDVEKG